MNREKGRYSDTSPYRRNKTQEHRSKSKKIESRAKRKSTEKVDTRLEQLSFNIERNSFETALRHPARRPLFLPPPCDLKCAETGQRSRSRIHQTVGLCVRTEPVGNRCSRIEQTQRFGEPLSVVFLSLRLCLSLSHGQHVIDSRCLPRIKRERRVEATGHDGHEQLQLRLQVK